MTDDHIDLSLSRETIETILRTLHVVVERGDKQAVRQALNAEDAVHAALLRHGLTVSISAFEPQRRKLLRR